MRASNLRVEVGGVGINDYRINDGDLEVRALTPDGHLYSDVRSAWRRMTPSDIALHYRLNTVVGKWLEDKMAEWEARTFLIKELRHDVLEP
jgi:hypothetical protein